MSKSKNACAARKIARQQRGKYPHLSPHLDDFEGA
jgi:hypothetical protein